MESYFCVRCSPVSLLCVFGASYHEMVSERLLLIHHRLQILCIANVNTCIKEPDGKTIVFCKSLQIVILATLIKKLMLNFCKRKKGGKSV